MFEDLAILSPHTTERNARAPTTWRAAPRELPILNSYRRHRRGNKDDRIPGRQSGSLHHHAPSGPA
jgi:hypothetical protein